MSGDARILRRAEELDLVEDVLSTIGHDIRNKLAAVRQASHYLKTKSQTTPLWETDPRMARFFALIDDQLEAADAMFRSHPVLAQIHVRRPEILDPSRVVGEAVRLCRESESVDIGEVLPGRPFADEAEIVVALRALVDNALDATESGRPAISGRPDGALYVFTVTNRGPRLDAESFRRFTSAFTTSREGRRGMGLSTARHVASRYGGTLALREDHASGQGDLTSIDLSVGQATAQPSSIDASSSRRILVVDDDESALITLAALLEDEGFDVVTASSLEDGERACAEGAPFAAVFIDYHIDGAVGTALVPAIRAHNASAAVVLVTGDAVGRLPSGVDGWIVKGGDPKALVEAAVGYARGPIKETGS